jgi:Lon protease-like protein
MKSPYKLSQELSVTPQAVYKKIKQLNNQLSLHIKKENNKILLNDEAERILRNSFSEVQQPVEQPVVEQLNNQHDEFNNRFNGEIDFLREQNKTLQEQNKSLQDELNIERNHSRDITNKLIELTQNSQELTRNSQVLLKQEQDKNTLLLSDERPSDVSENGDTAKKSIWQKLFKQKNK